MSRSLEFNGATVEEALEKARASLGLDERVLQYEILDEGSSGFLGIGARDARIAVRVPEEAEHTSTGSQAFISPTADFVKEEKFEENGQPEPEVSASGSEVPAEILDDIRDYLSKAVSKMGIEGRVEVYDAGDYIAADVDAVETGLFIGQKGETIDALQYLVNVTVAKRHGFTKRIILDAEGYRQRRIEALQGMAHRSARRAVRERRTIELPPMSSAERRIVHLFLRDDERVTTFSEGSGENRRVKIAPVRRRVSRETRR